VGSGGASSYHFPDYQGTAVIAFANPKGGVGRTSICANVAAALAHQGTRVLCVDLDPQGGLTSALGLTAQLGAGGGADLLLAASDAPLAAAALSTTVEHLELVAAGPELAACAESLAGEARERALRAKLTASCRNGAAGRYDLILLDCPASLGPLTRNGITAATHLVVPVTPRLAALKGAAALGAVVEALHRCAGATAKLLGLVVTMCDESVCLDTTLCRLLRERVQGEFGDYVFASVIGQSVAIAEAEAGGLPVVLSRPDSPAASWYQSLAEELLARLRQDSAAEVSTARHAAVA
jgi:chromosome partitioning protein